MLHVNCQTFRADNRFLLNRFLLLRFGVDGGVPCSVSLMLPGSGGVSSKSVSSVPNLLACLSLSDGCLPASSGCLSRWCTIRVSLHFDGLCNSGVASVSVSVLPCWGVEKILCELGALSESGVPSVGVSSVHCELLSVNGQACCIGL